MQKVLIQFVVLIAAVVGLSFVSAGLWGGRLKGQMENRPLVVEQGMTLGQLGQGNKLPPIGSKGVIFPPQLIWFGAFLLIVIVADKFIYSWDCQLGTLQDAIFHLNTDRQNRKELARQFKTPFASMQPEFDKLNCKLLGLSIDSTYSHIAWLRTIKEKIEYKGMKDLEVTFPVISDLTMEVSKAFGMLQPAASNTQAVRAVFIIDPKAIVRAILYYPLSNGRNVDEVKRLLIAMQHSDEHGIATPANWQIGDDVIVPPPGSCGTAKERVEKPSADTKVLDWFMCLKKCPHK